ncbi:MAG: PAS domain-containing sensor histidine kinase [Bacteroidales bacterium]|nr:PAS domain-containing sensor histidine kinase [Bacteroidales bacterium]
MMLMNQNLSLVLQLNVNPQLEIVQILIVNAPNVNNTIKVGQNFKEIINDNSLLHLISEVIQQGKVNEEIEVKLSNTLLIGSFKLIINKIHPQLYSIIFLKHLNSLKTENKFNPLENLLLNLSTDGIILVNRFGYIQYCNKAFYEMSKYSMNLLKNKLFYPLFIRSNEWSISSDKEVFHNDEMIALDGAIIPVQIRKHTLKISETEKGVVYIVKNISQLKSVENELNIREKIIESIFYASRQFLFSTNWEENIFNVLAHLGKAIKASRINLIENRVNSKDEICMKFNTIWTIDHLNQNILANQKCVPYFPEHDELFFELSAGNIYYIDADEKYAFYHQHMNIKSAILIPIFMQDEWWGFLGVDECYQHRAFKNSEIHALKQIADLIGAAIYQQKILKQTQLLKEKSEESDRLKTAFLSNIGHELRTPLNAVIGFSELLKKNNLEPEKQKEFIQHIIDNSQKLLQSIDHLVNFAKLEANTIVIKPETINIFNFLNEIAFFTKNEINKSRKNIDVSINCNSYDFQIITNKKLLVQTFTQLLTNAIKFTLNGRIEIGCRLKDELFEFYVLDTGIGIEHDKLSVVFNRFRILENETTRTNPGMGIGLPITKRIIEKLNGHIWIESELNHGTTVFFTLPKEIISNTTYNTQQSIDKLEPSTLYLLEERNDIFYKIYSILKVEFNNIIRIKKVEEIKPEKASIIILNSSNLNPSDVQYLKNLQKQYPQIKLMSQSFNIQHNTTPNIDGFTLLPQNYGQILPTIKSILKR